MLTEVTRQSRTISRVEEIRDYCQEAPRYRQDILDYFQSQWSKSETTVAQAIQSALRQGGHRIPERKICSMSYTPEQRNKQLRLWGYKYYGSHRHWAVPDLRVYADEGDRRRGCVICGQQYDSLIHKNTTEE
jgi:hypothetical protein